MGFRDKLKSGLRSSKPDSSTPSRNPSPAPPVKTAPAPTAPAPAPAAPAPAAPTPAAPTPAAPPAAASKAPSETKVVSQPKEPVKQDAPAEDNLPVPSLQEKIWNQAYDNLKESNAKLTDAYEKILSAELQGQEPTGSATIKNEISDNREARNKQMQAMVSKGLERTKRQTSIKEGLGQGLQVVDSVRGIVDQSIQAAPQAAVAWVGVCMGLEILSNPVSEASSNRAGISYVLSRMEWYWNLVPLLLKENKAEASQAALRDQLEKHVVQLYEILLEFQLKSVVLYYRNWAVVIGRDLFKIDDWAGQLSGIQSAEASVKADMDQYNTEESKLHLQKIADSSTAMKSNLESINSAIEEQTRQQEKRHQTVEDNNCLRDLRETDPRHDKHRIQETKGGLLKDSYSWILQNDEFVRWQSGSQDDADTQILWIKADPGRGKTMLLCGIIDELQKQNSTRLAYFFCQATEAQLSNATAVLRGLVYYIVEQQPSLLSYVREEYDHAGKQLFEDHNSWNALCDILTAILKDPKMVGATLIIDALDECTTNLDDLLDFICNATSVRWIVSSRNWNIISERLEGQTQAQIELNNDLISEAVDVYIGHIVEKLKVLKRYDAATEEAVRRHLTDNADSTFLWVALVYQELQDPKVQRKRHTLSKLEVFPRGLEPLYARMLENISESADADICHEILGIASVVYRPVHLEELKLYVDSLEEEDYEDLPQIIQSCGSFLAIRENVLYLLHQSAKDYLVTKASDTILPGGVSQQHLSLLTKSLDALLSDRLKRHMCDLEAPGTLTDSIEPGQLEPLVGIRYPCIYWADHLNDTSSPDEVPTERLYSFLEEKFLHWLESLGLLRSLADGVKAIQKLQQFLTTNEASQELRSLAHDAHRFLLANKRPIELAPLQAYAAALLFSPENSLIRKKFESEVPSWIVAKPKMPADWSACLQTLEEHKGTVYKVAFFGRKVASCGKDETVRIWESDTGACLRTLKGHSGQVEAIAADGDRLASGSQDKTIKISDTQTGACLQTFEGHTGDVASLAFAGQYLVSGSRDETIKVWNLKTGKCVRTIEGLGPWQPSVATSPDGSRIVSTNGDTNIKVWNLSTGDCLKTLEGHQIQGTTAVYSPDGTHIASGSGGMTLRIFNAESGEVVRLLQGHGNRINSLAYSPDGKYLASVSDDAYMILWDVHKGESAQTFYGHTSWTHSVSYSPDGQLIASSSDDQTVRIWDTSTIGGGMQRPQGYQEGISSYTFSKDARLFGTVSFDSSAKIWNTANGECLHVLNHSGWVRAISFSPDSKLVAVGSDFGATKIWDASTGECLKELENGGGVSFIVFSPDGRNFATGSIDGLVTVWEVEAGKVLYNMRGNHGGSAMAAAFDKDGQRLAVLFSDSCVIVWSTETTERIQEWETEIYTPEAIAFHPTQSNLISTEDYILDLDAPSKPPDQESKTFAAPEPVTTSGYHMDEETEWILKGEERMVWVPPEYRPRHQAAAGCYLAICCASRVLLIGLS